MPIARIAIESAMIQGSPTRNATSAPTIAQATAPTISDAIGANSDATSAARISVGSFASALRVWSSFVISMWLERLPRCRRSYVAKLNMMQTAQPIDGIDERVANGGVTISIKLFRIARPVTMLFEQKQRLSKWNSEAPRENFLCSLYPF